MQSNIEFMKEALKEAKIAYEIGEVPVGCVIVKDNEIIARAHNLKEFKNSVTAHAEILAINKAADTFNNWRLDGCTMYVTLEPCAMCMGAIMQSHISNVYYAVSDKMMGACGSKISLFEYNFQNPSINVVKGLCENESLELIKDFFINLRNK